MKLLHQTHVRPDKTWAFENQIGKAALTRKRLNATSAIRRRNVSSCRCSECAETGTGCGNAERTARVENDVVRQETHGAIRQLASINCFLQLFRIHSNQLNVAESKWSTTLNASGAMPFPTSNQMIS